jgi:hypothetical protein
MSEAAVCATCGADWARGDHGAACPECGGGALVRACPRCAGLCGAEWRRAILDSHDARLAHWVGRCGLAQVDPAHLAPGRSHEWWLDEAALPDRIWACLVEVRGSTSIVDCDGIAHAFPDRDAAAAWLREDEYDTLSSLKGTGDVDRDAVPPRHLIERVASFSAGA